MLLLSVARWNYVLFGSVVVCSQAALFTVVEFIFFFRPGRMAGTSLLSFTVRLNELPVLCLVYSPKLFIWLFTSSELKVRKHFQIELHGCNQYSGDR